MEEDRKEKRVYFNPNTEVVGSFHPVNAPQNSFCGRILNLSLDGLFVSISKEWGLDFKINDLLVLNEFHSNSIINLTTNILLEVRWIHFMGIADFVGCGCQFIEISDNGTEQVRKLLEWGGQMNAL